MSVSLHYNGQFKLPYTNTPIGDERYIKCLNNYIMLLNGDMCSHTESTKILANVLETVHIFVRSWKFPLLDCNSHEMSHQDISGDSCPHISPQHVADILKKAYIILAEVVNGGVHTTQFQTDAQEIQFTHQMTQTDKRSKGC